MILTSSLYESIKLVKKFLNEKTASKKNIHKNHFLCCI